jgi:hypothetical protein
MRVMLLTLLFINLEVINRAISDLLIYLEKKSNEMKTIEQLMRKSPKIQSLLNYRQVALIIRALKRE